MELNEGRTLVGGKGTGELIWPAEKMKGVRLLDPVSAYGLCRAYGLKTADCT